MQNTDVDGQIDSAGHSGAYTDDNSSGLPRRRPKKLYHKKSRTGCATCRSRRVKVDSMRPFSPFILIGYSVMKSILSVETVQDTG